MPVDETEARELDKKYNILRKTFYREEDLKNLQNQISETLEQNPTWRKEWITDTTLQRHLIHANSDVTKAYSDVIKMCRWKSANRVESLTLQHPDIQVEHKKNRGEILTKRDVCGRPVVLFRVRNHDKNHGNPERVEKYIMYVLEELSRLSDEFADGMFTTVFDLQGFGYNNMDLHMTKRALGMLARYYPQRIGVILLVNYPLVFQGFWKVVRLLMDDTERSQVVFCGKSELSDFVDVTIPLFQRLVE